MNKQSKKIIELFIRYSIILLAGLGNLYIIYKLLTPLTVHTLNIILSIFTKTTLIENVIFISKIGIKIIPACVAGAAFYLLLILILSTSDIKLKTRIKALSTAFLMLFSLNIVRILILISLINTPSFEMIHWIFWHLISTVFVIATWIGTVKIYKIKSIPVYSDIKYIKSLINPIKKSKRKKKNK